MLLRHKTNVITFSSPIDVLESTSINDVAFMVCHSNKRFSKTKGGYVPKLNLIKARTKILFSIIMGFERKYFLAYFIVLEELSPALSLLAGFLNIFIFSCYYSVTT